MLTQSDPWLPLAEVRITRSGRLESKMRLHRSSEWFSGHFEAHPLLPGVAILAFAVEAVRRHGHREGRTLAVTGFSRVRFKRVVHPDEDLYLAVDAMPPQPEASLRFEITSGENDIARGILKVRESYGLVPPGK